MPDGMTLLWYLDDEGQPAAVAVRTGLSDGQSTEIRVGPRQAEALEPGQQIIAGVVASSQSSSSSPFQSRQQSSRPGPPGPGF